MKFQIIAGELCLDFINTLDNRPVAKRRQELLPTYEAMVEWAAQAGGLLAAQRGALLCEAESHPKDAEAIRIRAIEFRECLYRMVTALTRNRRASAEDLKSFNAYLAHALSHLELKQMRGGIRLDWPDHPSRLDSVLWPIARSASDLLTGGDLKYVRECGADTCRWLFVDRSKNHSRRWCDMKVCGNRIKARKFYRRQSAGRNAG